MVQMKQKLVNLYRIKNAPPKAFPAGNFNHCFSADFIEDNPVQIKISSILDPKDNSKFDCIFELTQKDLDTLAHYIVKI